MTLLLPLAGEGWDEGVERAARGFARRDALAFPAFGRALPSPASGRGLLAGLLLFVLAVLAAPAAAAPDFPELTGRVVDAANILPPESEISIEAKLAALEASTTRQLVVATVPDLDGMDIADYGYQLGRAWGIGQKDEDNGALLIVAPNERRVRVEVGYGLEPVLTDALSSLIIQRNILPAFREGDMPRGVEAGVDAIVAQLRLPAEEAQANIAAAEAQAAEAAGDGGSGFGLGSIFWIAILLFWVVPMMLGGRRGRRYRRSNGVAEAVLWGVASAAMNSRSSRGGDWGGGGGFGGGGFGGGGGSFGGGGASGGW